MILSNVLVGIAQDEQKQLISVSFTALIFNELIMIALEINTWHKYMIWAELLTFVSYCVSIPWLGDYFGMHLLTQECTDVRFIVYHYTSICLEDYGNTVG